VHEALRDLAAMLGALTDSAVILSASARHMPARSIAFQTPPVTAGLNADLHRAAGAA